MLMLSLVGNVRNERCQKEGVPTQHRNGAAQIDTLPRCIGNNRGIGGQQATQRGSQHYGCTNSERQILQPTEHYEARQPGTPAQPLPRSFHFGCHADLDVKSREMFCFFVLQAPPRCSTNRPQGHGRR